jgi:hypothetical protein
VPQTQSSANGSMTVFADRNLRELLSTVASVAHPKGFVAPRLGRITQNLTTSLVGSQSRPASCRHRIFGIAQNPIKMTVTAALPDLSRGSQPSSTEQPAFRTVVMKGHTSNFRNVLASNRLAAAKYLIAISGLSLTVFYADVSLAQTTPVATLSTGLTPVATPFDKPG